MAADMPVDGLRIGLFLPSPQFVQGPLQRRILQNQAVGNVNQLARVVVFKQRGQLRVAQRVERRNVGKVRRHMVILRRLVKRRQRLVVHLAVQIRLLL